MAYITNLIWGKDLHTIFLFYLPFGDMLFFALNNIYLVPDNLTLYFDIHNMDI